MTNLFKAESPENMPEDKDYKGGLNPDSLIERDYCRVEPSLAGVPVGTVYQFERRGYFCVDPESTAETPVFNRTVRLRDTWLKIAKRQSGGREQRLPSK